MSRTIQLSIAAALACGLLVACVPGDGGSGGSGGEPTDAVVGGDRGPEAGTEPDRGTESDNGLDPDGGTQPDGGTDPDGGPVVDQGVEPDGGPPPIAELGASCGPPLDCDPDALDWPECIDLSCVITHDCLRPVLADDYGYCTQPCTRDADCLDAVVGGPYGDDFVCLTDGESGRCVPGSGVACALADNPPCAANEVCRWGLGYVQGEDFGPTCQTPTHQGRGTGEPCDEDAGIRCANDMCLFGVCTSLCVPGPPTPPGLCPADWGCFEGFDIGVLVDICLPNYCDTDQECGDGSTCVLSFEFNSREVLRGICLPTDPALAQPGGQCSDARPCQGGTCFDAGADGGYCAGLCRGDADCGPDAYCDVVSFGIDAGGGTAPAKLCRPGVRSGSGRDCSRDADCAAEGDTPDEACEYVVRGELESGRFVEPPRVEGRCAAIPPGAVAEGEACDDQRLCRTESLCLNGGGRSFCSAACRVSADCGGGLCFAIDFSGALPAGVCIPPELLGADGSSLASCARDADCPNVGEACRVNLIEADPPVAETICMTDGGAGPPGSLCVEDEDCASLDCAPRPAGGGYCRAPCGDDIDCGEGFVCAPVMIEEGAEAVMLCEVAM